MIVTFCGHKENYGVTDLTGKLLDVIRPLILEGADIFYLGGYGNFDSCAAQAVNELKNEFPHIKSILVIPYINRTYNEKLYDESVYPPIENVPLRFAISKRNEWMVEKSDIVVSGVVRDWGGAYSTLQYAKRKNKRIITVLENSL